ncbi:MAG: glucans biosynthesis glucosyltransferase MdoH [Pseudomonadota bacterium]
MTIFQRFPLARAAKTALPDPADPAPQPQGDATLAMPNQRFDAPFHDPAATRRLHLTPAVALSRLLCLGLPLAASVTLGWASFDWFTADDQLTWVEGSLVLATGFAYFWMLLSVMSALLGLLWRPRAIAKPLAGVDCAILLPMYGEAPTQTIGEAVRLLRGLSLTDTAHRFSLHVLSDTRDAAAVSAEHAVVRLAQSQNPYLAIQYRNRTDNADYKTGNLREWVTRTGAAHEAMLVLDADSVMSPAAVLALTDTLASDGSLGLVQSIPRVLPGDTLWQRMQSFASQVYGVNLARGFTLWTGTEGNFMGHNAVLRTRAFAACAGLPHLPGRRPLGGCILSHDFVEAALLRRAGWGVKMLPEAADSFEDTPATLIGYIRRDRRWCQGNMQHLRLLAMPGLHPLSRFHLFQGAMAYLASVWWLFLLGLWAVLGDGSAIRYFSATNGLFPIWPDQPLVTPVAMAGLVAAMLLGPKLIGIAAYIRDGNLPAARALPFAATVLAEMVLSMLMAPMLMVHQVRAVLRTWAGFDGGWAPHDQGRPSLQTLLRFHATETWLGVGLTALALAGFVTPWLLPVAICLCLSVPLAALVSCDAQRLPLFSARAAA